MLFSVGTINLVRFASGFLRYRRYLGHCWERVLNLLGSSMGFNDLIMFHFAFLHFLMILGHVEVAEDEVLHFGITLVISRNYLKAPQQWPKLKRKWEKLDGTSQGFFVESLANIRLRTHHLTTLTLNSVQNTYGNAKKLDRS